MPETNPYCEALGIQVPRLDAAKHNRARMAPLAVLEAVNGEQE